MASNLIFKLVTGEEIIGKVGNRFQDYLIVSDPFVIKTQWTPGGELQMGLIPFFPYANRNELKLNVSGYVAECEPVEALNKEYVKQTSGIILP